MVKANVVVVPDVVAVTDALPQAVPVVVVPTAIVGVTPSAPGVQNGMTYLHWF